jgi:hypothetical protein
MKTITRVIITSLVVLLMGSMTESNAEARGDHGGHGPHVGIGLWLGPGWGPGWWGPNYYPYYYPYYQETPIVIEHQPEIHVQPTPQAEQPIYWYYCKDPQQGYYPYVKQCPGGWMKVVPTPPAPSSSPTE